MSRERVLITNATSDAGMSAARSLVRAGYEVMSADVTDMPYGLTSRFISAHYVLANGSSGAYEEGLLALVARVRPDVLLPLGNQSTFASVARHERLSDFTALNVPDSEAVSSAQDKVATEASLKALGIPCAKILSYDDAVAALSGNAAFAFVVKPRANIGAAVGVRYVKNRQELDDAVAACRSAHGEPLIQEFVPGGPEAMKTVVLLYSSDSNLIAAFTTAKKRAWPTTGGLTVVSQSTRDEAIVEQVKPFFEHWRWKGPAEVEIKRDARSSVDKVIEINPRFPAYFRFADRCGLDFATLAARLALEENVNTLRYPAYRLGVTYVNADLLIRSAAWHVRNSQASGLGGMLSDLGAGFGCIGGMLSDPAPVVGRVIRGFIRKGSAASHLPVKVP